jgi:hypothetical protein
MALVLLKPYITDVQISDSKIKMFVSILITSVTLVKIRGKIKCFILGKCKYNCI